MVSVARVLTIVTAIKYPCYCIFTDGRLVIIEVIVAVAVIVVIIVDLLI